MSPLMMRFFTLAGIALAASMQLKARAETLEEVHLLPSVQCVSFATLQESAR
jgi:hypothetical protein